jgi:hypothetical protein
VKVEFGRDWSEFLSLLISHRVRFVLVGGHAVAAHGEPRLTEDLDVLVGPGVANARRLRAALVEFGFGSMLPSLRELARPGRIWMLGRKPWRIDILSRIDGVDFARVWKGRVHARFRTGPLPIIGLAELIANKKAAARPKDLADVARLEVLRVGRKRHSARKARQRAPRR